MVVPLSSAWLLALLGGLGSGAAAQSGLVSGLEHRLTLGRQQLRQRQRQRGGPDGAATFEPLTTQRWVGAQSPDDRTVSEMSCSFAVPADADIGTMPQKGTDQVQLQARLHSGSTRSSSAERAG